MKLMANLKKTISRFYHKEKAPTSRQTFNLPLPLPDGVSKDRLYDFVTSICVEGAPLTEMAAYAKNDFRRFVFTWGLAREINGHCLELGGNPYFTTMLLKQFTRMRVSIANFFNEGAPKEQEQKVSYVDINSGEKAEKNFKFKHFNIEKEIFPYDNESFDAVIFAEIIEHLLNDPSGVLREIKRVLKKDGTLILTTPNVARLENVSKLLSGSNIYDPYSGYGPYGRHNREYNRHELHHLLLFEGFEVVESFTADVHGDAAGQYFDLETVNNLVEFRKEDLGQYIFLRAVVRDKSIRSVRPGWLYRSYPDGQLV